MQVVVGRMACSTSVSRANGTSVCLGEARASTIAHSARSNERVPVRCSAAQENRAKVDHLIVRMTSQRLVDNERA